MSLKFTTVYRLRDITKEGVVSESIVSGARPILVQPDSIPIEVKHLAYTEAVEYRVNNEMMWERRFIGSLVKDRPDGTLIYIDRFASKEDAKVFRELTPLTLQVWKSMRGKVYGWGEIDENMNTDEDLQRFWYDRLVDENWINRESTS